MGSEYVKAILAIIILLSLALWGAYLIIAALNSQDAGVNYRHLCEKNGYADRVWINNQQYCYRLNGNTGELILADSLKEDK
jgi:hypothetical protein